MPNVIYEKLKKLADEAGLTSEQVAGATKKQAATMMGTDELERAKWQKALEGLKAQLIGGGRVWLKENYPNAEFEINFKRKTVTIYFEGKPVVEDVD